LTHPKPGFYHYKSKEIINMKDETNRREFLGRAALAALTLPGVFQGGVEMGHAMGGSSTGAPK
jgi:hypothetical protein